MNEADTVEIDDTDTQASWFETEAAGFMGAPARPDCGAERDPST